MHERPLTSVYHIETQLLSVTGAVDELNAAEFRTMLDEAAAAAPESLVVDLSEVDYLPSTAVGVLATVTRGSTIRLRAERGSVAERVLHMCGLPHEAI